MYGEVYTATPFPGPPGSSSEVQWQRLQRSLHQLNVAIGAAETALAKANAARDIQNVLRYEEALRGLRTQARDTVAAMNRLSGTILRTETPSGLSLGIADWGTRIADVFKKLGTAGAMALAAVLILTFARRK